MDYTHLECQKWPMILEGGALFVCKYVLLHILTILSVFAFLVWKAY